MNKNKKNIILVFFLLLFLILVGYLIYDYTQYKKETEVISREIPKSIEYESIENYEIIETEKGKMVKNENVGLSFIVPDGWNIDKIEEDKEIEIYTSDIDKTGLGLKTNFPINGCIIKLGVAYFSQNFSDQKQRPEIITEKIEKKEELLQNIEEIISVNNYPSLKTLKFKGSELGRIILIETPIYNTIYHFGISFSSNNEKNCSEEFDKFLETILIDI